MKSYTNLYARICDIETLRSAYTKCRKGKGDLEYAKKFEDNAEENLLKIQAELLSDTWKPLGYTQFEVTDPKRRLINAPDFRDRIVHRAIYDVIFPLFEKGWIYDSYACRIGKGTHRGVRRIQQFFRTAPEGSYYLKADIKSYFASIDHRVLFEIIQKRIRDPKVRNILWKIIDSYHESPGVGIPLGNLTSQMFANVLLDKLDQYIKHTLRIRYYIRYMDDFLVVAEDKDTLWKVREKIKTLLASLNLCLHPRKQVVAPVCKGVDFLGYVVFKDYIRLRNRNIHREYARMKKIDAGTFTKDPMASIMSWMGYSIHGDAYGLNESIKERYPILAVGTVKFYGT